MSDSIDRITELTKRLNDIALVKSLIEAQLSREPMLARNVIYAIDHQVAELLRERDRTIAYRAAEMIAEEAKLVDESDDLLEALHAVINRISIDRKKAKEST